MRSRFIWLLAVLLSLPLAMTPWKAMASSAYDDTVHSINDITIRCYNYTNGLLTGDTHTLSASWSAFLDPAKTSFEGRAINRSSGSIDPDDVYDAFQDRLSDGKGWSVTVLDYQASEGNFLRLFVQKNTNPAYFMNVGGGDPAWNSLVSDSTYILTVHCRNDGFLVEITEGQAIYARNGSGYNYIYLMKTDVTYPSGYEGELAPSQPPTPAYVAMGDSFSSGEGNPEFEYKTDQDDVNECHRSPKGYPRLLQNDPSLDLGPTAFVACSGATTDSIRFGHPGVGNWDEGAQVNALSSTTELVTLTVGGNDVNFVGYAVSCGVSPCGVGTSAYNDMMGRINDPSFKTKLVNTYTGILDAAENATVYVLDYPYMVDPTGTDGIACEPLVDLSAAVPVQMALNSVIEDAVGEVRDLDPAYYGRLVYMPTNFVGSPFIDHHLCTDDPGGSYFNGLNLSDSEYSFHPNANGQQAYYQIMEDYLS